MTMKTTIRASILAKLTETLDLGDRTATATGKTDITLTSGTGAGMADKVFQDTRSLAGSASESLDLAGVLTDPFGGVLTFVKVKALYIASADENLNDIVVGAAAATPWSALLGATGTVTLRPGAFFLACAGVADASGYAVGAGATDLLKVLNNAGVNTVLYDIVIVGTSA